MKYPFLDLSYHQTFFPGQESGTHLDFVHELQYLSMRNVKKELRKLKLIVEKYKAKLFTDKQFQFELV